MPSTNSTKIAILGAPNSDDGTLSNIAIERCNKALELVRKKNKQVDLILTGGFGAFNTTQYPHFKYQEKYLIEKGIKSTQISAKLMSANTVEDIREILNFCKSANIGSLTVVTSDFHVPRVKILFDLMMKTKFISLNFEGATTETSRSNMATLMSHEANAIRHLVNGLNP